MWMVRENNIRYDSQVSLPSTLESEFTYSGGDSSENLQVYNSSYMMFWERGIIEVVKRSVVPRDSGARRNK